MAFWNRRREESLTDGRKFKQADLSGFVPPVFVAEREIRASDEELINKLMTSFKDAGVISEEEQYADEEEQSIEEVMEIIQEANANALTEKDFHANKVFDEKLHQELDNYETEFEDGDNFLLDGMDDYGNQIYEAGEGFNSVWD